MVQFSEKIDKKKCFFLPQKMIFFGALGDFFWGQTRKKGATNKKMLTMIQFINKMIYNFSSFLPL